MQAVQVSRWHRPSAGLRSGPAAPRGAVMARAVSRSGSDTLVKICGVTNPDDAATAVKAGADLVGMIMWPKAKRSVSDETAKAITETARSQGVDTVGVFVDEDAQTIVDRCKKAGIRVAQLHGDGARASLPGVQQAGMQVVYVMQATPDGQIQTQPPASPVDWVLIDGMQGGSGQALDWTQLQPPKSCFKKGWLLAGGLHPGNVSTAIKTAHPSGVDVSSGVCGPDGLKKDNTKIHDFVAGVKAASGQGAAA